ncbi:hypothetical protein B0H14DRAFT_2649964 [Mycena olivaceomarginata]|nr:hypothetical protein B0H14DRAFT_2649964 [Mycena olivaceomarginata]
MGEAALEAPAPGGLSERNDVPTDPGLPEMTSADVDEVAQDSGRLALKSQQEKCAAGEQTGACESDTPTIQAILHFSVFRMWRNTGRSGRIGSEDVALNSPHRKGQMTESLISSSDTMGKGQDGPPEL